MKKIIIITAILMFGKFGFSQSLDCAKYKNIKFYNPANPNRYSVRKDSIQEVFSNGKLEIVWGVKWRSECEYEMVCVKNLGNAPIIPGNKVICTIISSENECFTVSGIFYSEEFPNGDESKVKGCIKKD
jgi:hypothetical protein